MFAIFAYVLCVEKQPENGALLIAARIIAADSIVRRTDTAITKTHC